MEHNVYKASKQLMILPDSRFGTDTQEEFH